MKNYHCALLVDDDPVSNYINKMVISDIQGIKHTHDVMNGAEALRFIANHCDDIPEENCPDLILLDLNMPVMDGFEFLHTFKNLSYNKKNKVRIVVLTSSTNPEDIERIREMNIAGYLNKPLRQEELERILNSD